MKILITGDKGYIGRNLWKHLAPRHDLYGLDLPDNITDKNTNFPEVDCVVHLASYAGVRKSIENPKEYFDNNLGCAQRIFKEYPKTPILHASSSSVVELKSPYSMTKYAIELLSTALTVNMRFHTVWGGDGYRKDMLYGLAKEDKLTFVTNQKRDYTRVEDVCSAIEILADKTQGYSAYPLGRGHIDIGYGQPMSNVEFLKHIGYEKELEIRDGIEGVPESNETCANPTRILNLGWQPKYGLL